MLSDLRSRSRGVHVAEEVLDPSKGDAATLVHHLRQREREREVLEAEP